jgi:L-arabinose isomerase
MNKLRKPKAGVLQIASPRFKNLGIGTARGTYAQRKAGETKGILSEWQKHADLVYPGIVYGRDDIEAAMKQFSAEGVDFIIAEFLSWSEDFAWIRFLRDMPDTPVIFVNPAKTKVPFTDTLEEDDFIEYLCCGTLVGSLEAAGSIARVGRSHVSTVLGGRAELSEKVADYAAAARVRALLRQSTVGLLANYNEAMWSTYLDPYNVFTRLGPEIRFIAYSTYADAIAALADKECLDYKNDLLARYKMMDDVDDAKFEASVRASLALAKIGAQYDIDALVFNDIDAAMFQLIGLRAGFYHPWFNENRSVLVPEADMGAGLMTYIMKLLTDKHVNFIEPFHIETEFGTFAGGHAGPNDHNDAAWQENVLIARDVRFAKTKYKYAGAPFAWYRISPGRKTMAQLVEENGKYKLTCALADSLPGKHLLATYSHTIFKPVVPVNQLFEQILKVGTTQHFAVVDGDYCEQLRVLAEMMDFEFHWIK